jgi:cytochrome c biogenesis protein CcdA
MIENSARVEQFRADIAEMRLKDPATAREANLLRLGAVAMGAGVVLTIVAYLMSHGTTNALDQRDAIILAIGGVALTVTGAALFLRYSIAAFLRFWLVRLIYEQRAQADRVLQRPAPDAHATTDLT